MIKSFHIFLLGIPGGGKSEVYRRITKKLVEEKICEKFVRVDDFPKLWNIFQTDKEFKRCRRTDDGGYKVTDDNVWDDILKEVNTDVKNMQEDNKIIFIEFARPNYIESITNNFDKEILEKSLLLYIYCPFEICWERNVARHEKALEAGSDDHLVSREEMEKTYGTDDYEKLLSSDIAHTAMIDNSSSDLDKLDDKINDVIQKLKKIIK